MSKHPNSFRVRVWHLRTRTGKRGTTTAVRWTVGQREHQRTFPTRKLADSFRSALVGATHSGESFSEATGLPTSMTAGVTQTTWLEVAQRFVEAKWASASARHRKSLAEALTTITCSLTQQSSSAPSGEAQRHALMTWCFNVGARRTRARAEATPPADIADSLRWLASHSLSVEEATKPAQLRLVLDAIGRRLDGGHVAPSTLARKRSALNSTLDYAVEHDLIEANPLARMNTPRRIPAETVDRRVVVNPEQARALLGAVGAEHPALEAFFACMYYAGLRPSEVRHLAVRDLDLPGQDWGRLTLTGSTQAPGTRWTNSGEMDEDRALKHRASKDIRTVPASPELVAILRRHIASFPPGVGGRLFVTRTARAGVPLAPPFAKPVGGNSIYRAWAQARERSLTPEQVASPLARRPYDLRHAAVSLWLNAGVAPTQVAEWAGHSVAVLLRVYAKCIDGQEELATRRIDAALNQQGRTIERARV